MSVIGVLLGAGAAKSGPGEWVAVGGLTYFSAALAVIAIRSAANQVGRMRRCPTSPVQRSTQGEKR